MQAIMLDEKQMSIVTQFRGSVQVRDQAGGLLGQIIPYGAADERRDEDRWIECWNEWYSETDE
jgi:hypothetical protein